MQLITRKSASNLLAVLIYVNHKRKNYKIEVNSKYDNILGIENLLVLELGQLPERWKNDGASWQ